MPLCFVTIGTLLHFLFISCDCLIFSFYKDATHIFVHDSVTPPTYITTALAWNYPCAYLIKPEDPRVIAQLTKEYRQEKVKLLIILLNLGPVICSRSQKRNGLDLKMRSSHIIHRKKEVCDEKQFLLVSV